MKTHQHHQSEIEKLKARNAWLEICLACALEELRKAFNYDQVLQQPGVEELSIEQEVEERR